MMPDRRQLLICISGLMLTMTCAGCLYHYHNAACKQRGAALQARIERLKEEAHSQLVPGTKKEAVIQFFEANGIPVTFVAGQATGTVNVKGCAPSGCGSDDASLGIRVKVDGKGTVISQPVVGSIYTDCL